MKKTIMMSMLIPLVSFSVDFSNLGEVTPQILKNTEKYKKLLDNRANVDKFIHLSRQFQSVDEKIIQSMNQYSGNDFMSKKEYAQVAQKVLDARKIIKKNGISNYILYLTSESVPDRAYANILHSVGILRENGLKVRSAQYLYGIPNDFKEYLFHKKDYFNSLPKKEREYILPNFKLKLDPRIFEKFNVKSAPAIVFATCKGKPTPQTCLYKYIIRGDVPLVTFFDKIREKDSRFDIYHQALLHNKINGE